MSRSFSVVATLSIVSTIAGLSLAHRAQAQVLTTVSRSAELEYAKLVTTGATDGAIRTWAQKNDLQILSMTRSRIELVAGQLTDVVDPNIVTMQACDPKKCAGKTTLEIVTNTLGAHSGLKKTTCSAANATSCKFVRDPNKPNGWLRMCEYRNCQSTISSIN